MFKAHQLALNIKRKCLSNFKWILGDGLELSVGFYNLFYKSCIPKSVSLLRSDNSLIDVKLVKELKYLDELGESSESRLLLPGEETQILNCPGETVVLANDEVAKLKTPISPSLQLLCFMESNKIPLELFVKPSGFIYPTEDYIVGSTKIFRAIWQKCLEMKKVAVCVLAKKKKSRPSFVALEACKNEPNCKIQSHDGFCAYYLPSFDNIRNIDIGEWKTDRPLNEQIEFFKQVVKRLRVNYDPRSKSLADPSLDELNAKIIALAFDLETEDIDPGINPDIEEQDQRINISEENVVEIFGEEDPITKKRSGPSNVGGNSTKKTKMNENDITENVIIQMVDRNSLEALSVMELKQYLQQKGVSGLSKLTKPMLIDKVKNLHS